MIALNDSGKESWVARWQNLVGRKCGLYAIRVTGAPANEYDD